MIQVSNSVLVDLKRWLSQTIVPQVLCAVLGLLIVWQITSGFISFFSLDKILSVRHDQRVDAIVLDHTSKNAGLKQAFFGDYVPHSLNEAGVRHSMLDLKIVGIIYGDNERHSYVLIRTDKGSEQTFAVGDMLPGHAVIKRITPEGVLILRDGALESLSLPKQTLRFEPPAKPLGISN